MAFFLRSEPQPDRSNMDRKRETQVELAQHNFGTATITIAGFYVLSGCCQPLLMTLLKDSGLADSSCQLYMVFYYLGPAMFVFVLLSEPNFEWPSKIALLKGCGIACFDIFSSAMNYTGAALAGPTIFAIVYSSVTIWAALFSHFFLKRKMNFLQWIFVFSVFLGLTITTTHSRHLGSNVIHGTSLIVVGSAMHALTYVMCEGIMTVGEHRLTVKENCAIQGAVATLAFLVWQFVYTLPRFQEKIWLPMQTVETTVVYALLILGAFALSNTVHAITFFHTLRHFPGGSTSAGVMKALQAVLVFVFTDWAYCGRTGGDEMCFTSEKLLSLTTVVGGVIGYGIATQNAEESIRSDYQEVGDIRHNEKETLVTESHEI